MRHSFRPARIGAIVAAVIGVMAGSSAYADGIPYYAQSSSLPDVLVVIDASTPMSWSVPFKAFPNWRFDRSRMSIAAENILKTVQNNPDVRWGLMRTANASQTPGSCQPGVVLVQIGSQSTGTPTYNAFKTKVFDTYCRVLGSSAGGTEGTLNNKNCDWSKNGVCRASENEPVCDSTTYSGYPYAGKKDYYGAFLPDTTTGTAAKEWRRAMDPAVDPSGLCRKRAMLFIAGGGGSLGFGLGSCTSDAPGAVEQIYNYPEGAPYYYTGHNINTYVMAFNLSMDDSAATLDDMAEAGRGINWNGYDDPDVFAYDANNAANFNSVMTEILNKLLAGNYTNSNPVISRDYKDLYQAYFSILDNPSSVDKYYAWQGHLQDYVLDPATGAISSDQSQAFLGYVDVSNYMNKYTWTYRDIYTSYNDTASGDMFKRCEFSKDGVVSQSSLFWQQLELSTYSADDDLDGRPDGDNVDDSTDLSVGTQADADALIKFMAGYTGYDYEDRVTPRESWPLLDIYKSTPRLVGPPSSFVSDVSYAAFQDIQKNRPDMLLVGSNGGMIHAFSAAVNSSSTRTRSNGNELWSYIPRHLLPRLKEVWHMLLHPTYLDGTGAVTDVKNVALGDSSVPWGTVFVIGDAIHGTETECVVDPVTGMLSWQCGYYNALDVSAFNSSLWIPDPLWEFAGDGDILEAAATPEFGYLRDKTYPGLLRQVVFLPGQGTEEASGNLSSGTFAAPIYIVDAVDVADESDYVAKLQVPWTNKSTTYTLPRGLRGRPLGVDTDNDLLTDRLYIGDMEGYFHRFDLSSDDPAVWMSTSSRGTIFKPNVTYSVGTPALPITFPPAATYSPARDIWVYFGTGDPSTVTYGGPRGYFFMMEDKRVIASGSAKLNTTKFPVIQFSNGEGLAGEPVIANGIVFFTTYWVDISGSGCQWGKAKLWAVKYDSGAPALDTNGDGKVNSSDAKYIDLGRGIPSGVVVGYDRWYVQVNNGTVGGSSGSLKSGVISGAGSVEPLMPYGWSEVTGSAR